MLSTFIHLLPLSLCLFWAVIYALLCSRTRSFALVEVLLLLLAAALVPARLLPGEGAPVTIALVSQLIAPSLVPLCAMYLGQLRHDRSPKPAQWAWLVIPVALFTSATLLLGIAGVPAVQAFMLRLWSEGFGILPQYEGSLVHSFFISTVPVMRIAVAALSIILLAYMIRLLVRGRLKAANLRNFLFKGGRISVLQLQIFHLMVLLPLLPLATVLAEFGLLPAWLDLTIEVLEALALSLLAFTAFFSAREEIALGDMFGGWLFNYRPEKRNEADQELLDRIFVNASHETLDYARRSITDILEGNADGGDSRSRIASSIYSALSLSQEPDSLLARFQQLMTADKLFLQSGLTLADVAERLDSKPAYISKLVNKTYRLGFPELLNTLRVDYACKYLLEHPDARGEQVARESGFLSASSFNNCFKRIIGQTPKLWLASRHR